MYFDLQFRPLAVSRRVAIVTAAPEAARFGPAVLDAFESLLDVIDAERDVAALIYKSASTEVFLHGADLPALLSCGDRREIEGHCTRIHRLFARLAAARRPLVCAIAGECLDLGVELVLVSQGAVATDGPRTVFGMPQIGLGLPPIAGGLTRLRQRVGLTSALEIILDGKRRSPRAFAELGLLDHVVRPEALDAVALALARDRLDNAGGRPKRGLAKRILGGARASARRQLKQLQKMRGAGDDDSTSLSILDVVGRGLSVSDADAMRLEPPMFAELAVADATRARVDIERAAAELGQRLEAADVRGRKVERIGLVGAGVVGGDLAVAAADVGVAVRVREKEPAALARALGRIERGFASLEQRRKSLDVRRARARLSASLDLRGFDAMDLVFESVPENLIVKRRVFAELEDATRSRTILATHPRVHPVAEIAANMRHPERLVGVRFFRPLHRMRLCEVAAGPQTSPRALATALAFAHRVGKVPIVVRDAPGFFTARVLGVYLASAVAMLESGHRIEDIDRGATRAGWPIGPLQLLDSIGLQTAVDVGDVLAASLGPRAAIPAGLRELANRGRGFYVRSARGVAAPSTVDIGAYASIGMPDAAPSDPDDLGERLTLVAALEAVRCLQDEVIDGPASGNVAAVLGIGYPADRGGPFRHLSMRGLASMRSRLAALEERFGPRFRAPPLLVELAKQGRNFDALARGDA